MSATGRPGGARIPAARVAASTTAAGRARAGETRRAAAFLLAQRSCGTSLGRRTGETVLDITAVDRRHRRSHRAGHAGTGTRVEATVQGHAKREQVCHRQSTEICPHGEQPRMRRNHIPVRRYASRLDACGPHQCPRHRNPWRPNAGRGGTRSPGPMPAALASGRPHRVRTGCSPEKPTSERRRASDIRSSCGCRRWMHRMTAQKWHVHRQDNFLQKILYTVTYGRHMRGISGHSDHRFDGNA